MASSDNVLRGGLTPKHIDTGELMNILHFIPFIPQIITPPSSTDWFCYNTPCGDFSLAMMHGEGEEKAFPVKGPVICIITEGTMRSENEIFRKGESFYLPQADINCLFNGNYSLYAASSGC